MTICLAALCDDGHSCVLAADRMAVFDGSSVLSFHKDDLLHKIHKLTSNSVLLHSGNKKDADEIVARVRGQNSNEEFEKVIDKELCALINYRRDQVVTQLIGGDYTYGKLLQAIGPATSGPFFDVCKQARDVSLGQMLFIVQATSNRGDYAIYAACPPILFEKVYLDFAAVGSGANYALAALRIEQYTKSSSMSESLYQVYVAKKAAEIVYGVGEPTNMAIMTERGIDDVPEHAMHLLEQIRTSRKQYVLTDQESNELTQSLARSH
jgi:20S proteasome alpha/beta subunit